jgi:hypothetical protein
MPQPRSFGNGNAACPAFGRAEGIPCRCASIVPTTTSLDEALGGVGSARFWGVLPASMLTGFGTNVEPVDCLTARLPLNLYGLSALQM